MTAAGAISDVLDGVLARRSGPTRAGRDLEGLVDACFGAAALRGALRRTGDLAAWANREGLSACEALIKGEQGPFCFGAAPTIADLCLVPQLANARRFGVDVAAFPRLLEAEAAAREIKAFADAAPDRQPDAE